MERLKRPLTTRDKKLLELYLIQVKRDILERPNWTFLLIVSGVCGFIIYESWMTSIIWTVIGLLVLLTAIGGYLWIISKARRDYSDDEVKIEKLLKDGVVGICRYSCTDALLFQTEIDMCHIWALQIAPQEVMIWVDYQYEYANILPSKTFDLIDDERLVQILGKTISNGQGHFSPTFVSMSVVGNAAWSNLPDEQGAILKTTLDELLEEAKSWL